jgi:hypothetical protein
MARPKTFYGSLGLEATAEINNSDEITIVFDTLTCCFVLAGITNAVEFQRHLAWSRL